MFNVQTRGIVTPNAVVGMALFVGGLAQLLAGMWGMSIAHILTIEPFLTSP